MIFEGVTRKFSNIRTISKSNKYWLDQISYTHTHTLDGKQNLPKLQLLFSQFSPGLLVLSVIER